MYSKYHLFKKKNPSLTSPEIDLINLLIENDIVVG